MQRLSRFGMAVVCVWSTVAGLLAQQTESADVLPATRATDSAEGTVPDGLSAVDWSSIRSAHEAVRHAVVAVDDGYRARNPGQRWATHFDRRGFTVEPDAGGWSWGLELLRYGFAGSEQSVTGPAQVTGRDQRVAYDWDAVLTEWYVNEPRGLEHGYTVQRRPPQSDGGPLTFTLAVRGGLVPRVQDDGRGVSFANGDGTTVLIYTGLTVLDTDGKEVPAHFERAVEGLLLSIDEDSARYPLTVDPIAQQAYLKASNTGTDDRFGNSVAVSGDTIVVGAYLEDSNATGVNGDHGNDSAPDSGAAYVFVRSGSTWTQQAYLKASNTGAGDRFGVSVAISGDTVVVGAYGEDSNATGVNGNQGDNSSVDSGATYVFIRSGTTWTQQAYLKASNTDAMDFFGEAVSVSGDTVVIGTRFEASAATGVDGNQGNGAPAAGAAYVFVRNNTTWSQQAYLKASNTDGYDYFGCSLAVSGDTVVVGATGEDSSATGVDGNQGDNSASLAGAAYIFIRNGSTWTQQAYLKASNTDAYDSFAGSVAVSGDTVVVGAAFEGSNAIGVNGNQANNSAGVSGAAYVFVRSGTIWIQQAYLKASNTEAIDRFGCSVGVSDETVVVGASLEDSNARGVNGNQGDNSADDAGAAFVFVRDGSTWTQQAYLKASNTDALDNFAYSVAVSDSTVVVGAWEEDSSATGVNGNQGGNNASNSGAAYVFDLNLTAPRDVALLDVDSDGDLDAATANHATDDLALYANDGGGTLAAQALVSLTTADHGPTALAGGDLDNDGVRDDLAVACSDSNTVALVTNTGSATPTVVSLAAGGTNPVDVAVLDLDADPRDDVVVAFEGSPFGIGDGIAVSLDGGAFTPVTIPAPYPSKAVRLAHGDLDGDGDQDLAVLAQGGTDHILLFTGAGDGSLTFAGGIALPTSGLARGLCTGDLDGDGDLDLAVVLVTLFPTASTSVRIYTYTPSGGLDPTDYLASSDIATGGTFGVDVAFGDVDDDGVGDLAVVHAGSGDVEILNGWNGTSFASSSTPAVGANPIAVAIGDLSGGDDVVIANQGSNDITVLIIVQRALAYPYGAGCPGTGGLVPRLSGIGMPTIPSAGFGVQLSDAKAFAPALLLFSGGADTFDVGGGCALLLALPTASTLRFTDAFGADAFVFGVPALPALMGLDLYFQAAIFDPAGAFGPGVAALSNGLRVQVGS